jgi:hypothetical protein
MRSAFVPDGPASEGSGIGLAALAVGAAATLAVGIEIRLRDEPLSQRTLLLMMVAGLGGAAAASPVAATLAWFGRGWGRVSRSALGALATGGLFVPATLAAFAVQIRIFDARIEGDLASEIASGDILHSLFGAMGMFTPTGLRYLAPWPLAAVVVAAALVFLLRPGRAAASP